MKLGLQSVNITAQDYDNAVHLQGFAIRLEAGICAVVSQANQGAGEDVAGAKTETDGPAAAAEAVSEYLAIPHSGQPRNYSPYSPFEPLVTKAWRPSEIELLK
jgi:hypothetical protein